MNELGAPWQFASDDRAALVATRGWSASVVEPSVVGHAWGRWPFPPATPSVPGIPRGYLVEARKLTA